MRVRITRGCVHFFALTMLVCASGMVRAQDVVLEALQERRLQSRATEVLDNMKLLHAGQSRVESEWGYHGVLGPLPQVRFTIMDPWESFRIPEPEPVVFDTLHFAENLTWHRTLTGEETDFLLRFGEVLWVGVGGYVSTPLDTMATPEIRARMHSLFGTPTRVPVARSQPAMNAGSAYVQFEYWFVVNDLVPVVIMDRDGPFGRGVVIVVDEEHIGLFPIIVENLTQRILGVSRLMPYVDYYQSRERNAWFRTGYDGETYYVLETERPRWARRGQERAQWYDFR